VRAERALAAAAAVADPEVPVLTIADLGVLREVRLGEDGVVRVTITPTYSGCPAMDAIADDIRAALGAEGFDRVEIEVVLAPPWSTAWISETGRRRLIEYGIAPPGRRPHDGQGGPVPLTMGVTCPCCGSLRTRETSRFGSTACQSQWVCDSCLEPFDHFKDH
jgi:ring-1,2-phenylacetyl-CoA epoxidase subunit PaaD